MRNKRLFIIFGILLSLTLLIAIGSAVFGIKTVSAYCYNSDDEALIAKIEEEKSKIKGKSIFFLNESKLIENIESRVGGIKIVNIEKLFPNRVSINFIKLYEYFETVYDGKYFTFGIDGKILEENDASKGNNVIAVILPLTEKPEVNSSLESISGFSTLIELTDMLEKLDYRNTDTTFIMESIDFTDDNAITIKMRSGVTIELLHYDNAGEKLRKAMSLYMARPDCRRGGKITATNTDNVTYLPEENLRGE